MHCCKTKMIRRQNKPFETDEALRASLLSGMTLNSELRMRQGSFFIAVGLIAAGACYLEARPESGYIWKLYIHS